MSLVQSPSEALYRIMPETAIAEDDVDGILLLHGLGHAILALTAGKAFAPEDVRARGARGA